MYKATLFLSLFLGLSAAANAQVTVTGTLLGQDGKPMAAENVILTMMSMSRPVKMITPDKEGAYSVTIDSAGPWILRFAGVDHSSHNVALYLDSAALVEKGKPVAINLDVRLKGYSYIDSLEEVKIIGTFNNFSFKSPITMKKRPDGTFTAEFEAKADTFAYQVLGVEKTGRSINGTESERYAYDGGGDYRSVVTPHKDSVLIVFDPHKLVRTTGEGAVDFRDSNSAQARFAGIYERMLEDEKIFLDARSKYTESGDHVRKFKYDWSKELASLTERIKMEQIPAIRQGLLLSYLWLGVLGANLDSSMARMAFAEISPRSLLWSFSSEIFMFAPRFAHMSASQGEAYLQDVVDENPVVNTRVGALYILFMNAKGRNDTAMSTKYYDMLTTKYGETFYGKMVKARYSPVSSVRVGENVPPFSVVSMDDSTKVISNETLKGKYYLMDFWATWCRPCVEEMPNLDKAYREFKDRNFDILSLSLDVSPADVAKFRRDKWPMPWLHSFIGEAGGNKIIKDFDVFAIPMPILVDPKGTIIAMGEELRGDGLVTTLEKYMGK